MEYSYMSLTSQAENVSNRIIITVLWYLIIISTVILQVNHRKVRQKLPVQL